MRSPSRPVLRGEQTVESLGEIVMDCVEVIGNNSIGHSTAEIHEPCDRGPWRPGRRQTRQFTARFGLGRWGQRTEQRQMRGELVPLRREVGPPLGVEPGVVLGAQLGREDERTH